MLHYRLCGSALKSLKLDAISPDVPEPARFEPKITTDLFSFPEPVFKAPPRRVRKFFAHRILATLQRGCCRQRYSRVVQKGSLPRSRNLLSSK